MKKLILILLLSFISIVAFSQQNARYYRRIGVADIMRYNGTEASLDSINTFLPMPTGYFIYSAGIAYLMNEPVEEGNYVYFDSTIAYPFETTISEMEKRWTLNPNSLYKAVYDKTETNTLLASKAPSARNLTINGVSQTLESDRSWSVGDVSTAGSYSNPAWITTLAYAKITGAPSLATVASTGAYSDLTGKPTIPTNNNQLTNGNGYITGNQTITLTGDITGSGTTSIATTLPASGVTAGNYGIVTVNSKGIVTGGKRQEPYTGTTAGSGTYTVTYATAYSATPNIQFNINGGTVTNTARLTASSTTGFTITANNRVEIAGLLPTYPTLNGLVIDVLVTEK